MGNVRLIGLDLDGTVLTNDKKITPRVKAAIRSAMAAGIEVVPVTGRPEKGIHKILRSMPGLRYAVTSNGSMIYEHEGSWKPIVSLYVSMNDVFRIVGISRSHDCLCNCFVEGYGYMSRGAYNKLLAEFEGTPLESYVKESRRPDDDFEQFMLHCGERTENIWIHCKDKEEADEIEKEILACCDVTTLRTMPQDIECINMCADKGDALLYIAKELGIPREEVMAIGDSDNDLGLLKHVGIPVAMGNATENVKALTDWICSDNEHDGVAEVIESIL